MIFRNIRFFSGQTINFAEIRMNIDSDMAKNNIHGVESGLNSLIASINSNLLSENKESKALAMYLLNYSQSMARIYKTDLASNLATTSLSLIDSSIDKTLVITFTMYSLQTLSSIGKYEEAESMLEKKTTIAETLEESKLKADFFENLARLKFHMRKLEDSLVNFSTALRIYEAIHDRISAFKCEVYLSTLYRLSKSNSNSLVHLEKSSEFLKSDKFTISVDIIESISLYIQNVLALFPHDEAEKTLKDCLVAFEKQSVESQYAVYEKLCESIEQLKLNQEFGVFATELFIKFASKNFTEKPGNIGKALYLASLERLKLGHTMKAIEYAEQCLKIQEKTKQRRNMAAAYNLLAQVYMSAKNIEKASEYVEKFGKVAHETSDPSLLSLYTESSNTLKLLRQLV
jgi:tetratricopeptide (TPR) repeat protein